MRLLRRRIRAFFVLQAVVLLAALGVSLFFPFRNDAALSPLDHLAWRFAYLGFAMVFLNAFRTTRVPSSYRNLWAVAASCISLGGGLYLLLHSHGRVGLECRALATILIGCVGMYLYCRGGVAPAAERTPAANQPCET